FSIVTSTFLGSIYAFNPLGKDPCSISTECAPSSRSVKSTYKSNFFWIAVGLSTLAFPSNDTSTVLGTPVTTYFSLSILILTGISFNCSVSSEPPGVKFGSFCFVPADSIFTTNKYKIIAIASDTALTNHLLPNHLSIFLTSPLPSFVFRGLQV